MKDVRLYLEHILTAITRIEQYTQEGRAAFMASPMAQDAVSRNFEIIGEATKRLPMAFREAHPVLPWAEMAGFRDVLIHEYDRIDLDEVWLTVERDLPQLKVPLQRLLTDLDAGEDTQ